MTQHATTTGAADFYFGAVLAGASPAWRVEWNENLEWLLKRAVYHGVVAPLYERLRVSADAAAAPQELVSALRAIAKNQAMWEVRHLAYVKPALERLASIGARPILFKGTALKYQLYPNSLRARGDTDVIVAAECREDACASLEALSFRRETRVGEELATYQASFTRDDTREERHCIDLHWRISNGQVLANLFSHAELQQASVRVPALGDHGRAVGRIHALLIACMHRAVHRNVPYYSDGVAHLNDDRLIWLYDLHLILDAMSELELQETLVAARTKGLCAVVLDGLESSRNYLGTRIPEFLEAGLRVARDEAVGRYLEAGPGRQLWLDFCALPDMKVRVRFLREHLFPSETYMRFKYVENSTSPLWVLHARRILGGLAKLERRRLDARRQSD